MISRETEVGKRRGGFMRVKKRLLIKGEQQQKGGKKKGKKEPQRVPWAKSRKKKVYPRG